MDIQGAGVIDIQGAGVSSIGSVRQLVAVQLQVAQHGT